MTAKEIIDLWGEVGFTSVESQSEEAAEDVRIGDEGESAHIISAQDLNDNPELTEQGVKEGDVIGIPDSGVINTGSPAIQDPTTTTSGINEDGISDPANVIE